MDLSSIVFHKLLFLGEDCLVLGIVILDSHGSVFSLQYFNIDVIQTDFDFADGFFHDLDNFES